MDDLLFSCSSLSSNSPKILAVVPVAQTVNVEYDGTGKVCAKSANTSGDETSPENTPEKILDLAVTQSAGLVQSAAAADVPAADLPAAAPCAAAPVSTEEISALQSAAASPDPIDNTPAAEATAPQAAQLTEADSAVFSAFLPEAAKDLAADEESVAEAAAEATAATADEESVADAAAESTAAPADEESVAEAAAEAPAALKNTPFSLAKMIVPVVKMPAATVNSLVVTSNADDGEGSLRQVLASANDGDTITFNLAAGETTIHLTQELDVSALVTIDGTNAAGPVEIDAESTGRIFNVASYVGEFTVKNLALSGGAQDGGAVYCSGSSDESIAINLDSVQADGCVGGVGGIIAVMIGSLTLNVTDSTLENSASENEGGAIYVRADFVTANFTDSSVNGNTADTLQTGIGNGGGLNIVATASFSMNGATLSDNSTDGAGGAMWNYGTTTLTELEFARNHAALSGGAIFNDADEQDDPVLTVKQSAFTENSTDLNGGAVCNDDARLVLSESTVSGNTAAGSGGGVYNNTLGYVSISDVTFSDNSAVGEGAALFNGGSATLSASTFDTASDTVVNRGTLELTGSNCFAADVTNYGSVVFDGDSVVTIRDAAKLVNDADAAAQDVGSSAFILDRTSVTAGSGEFFDIVWQGDWGLSDAAQYSAVLDDDNTVGIALGGSFTDANDRLVWFGKNGDVAGLTDHVKLNSTYTTVDFQRFDTRSGIDEVYEDYNGVIEITGGYYDYDLYAGNASFEITGDVSLQRAAQGARGKFIFGGSYKAQGSNHSITVESGVTLDVERVVGGSLLVDSGDYADSETQVIFEADSSADLYSVYGGYMVQGGAVVNLTGDVTLEIDGNVASSDYIIAGDLSISKSQVVRTGDSHLSISDGSYVWIVAGGGMVGQAEATYTQLGSTYVEITGGTFQDGSVIFGGCASNHGLYGGNTRIEGNTNVLVDVSGDNKVILTCIYAASNGAGVVTGDTSVTFTGDGSNLSFINEYGGVSGDCAHLKSFVGGTRSLNFKDYSGAFDAPLIEKLDAITFTGSSVTITSTRWKASVFKNWSFDIDSSVVWKAAKNNDFKNDVLVFGKAGDALTEAWTVIDSDTDALFKNLGFASSVSLLGETASWKDVDKCWLSDSFKLYVDTAKHDLVVTLA